MHRKFRPHHAKRPDASPTLALGLALTLGLGAWLSACSPSTPRPASEPRSTSRLELQSLLGGSSDGFERITEPRPLAFPADHAPHDGVRTEWWYVTANLADEQGNGLGLHFTLFRNALRPDAPARVSSLGATHAWMGHLAFTDLARGEHRAFERFSREAPGLAGHEPNPWRVHLEDWELVGAEGFGERGGDPREPGFRLRAGAGDERIELSLSSAKPLVLQGQDGYSRKGPEPGNASLYYSATRLVAQGQWTSGGRTREVRGHAWLDREWSTSVLPAGTVGWDWLSLQLLDGRELMLYRLRTADGEASAFSQGTLVGLDGAPRDLGPTAFELGPLETWTSERSGARYPVAWRARVPGEDLDLRIAARLDDQELDLTVRYWEGAVEALDAESGERAGLGFLELTGYEPR
jgi:predicted secreted hydrolase